MSTCVVHVDSLADDSEKLPGIGAFWLLPENVSEFVRRAGDPAVNLRAEQVFQEVHFFHPPNAPATVLGATKLGYRVFLARPANVRVHQGIPGLF